MRKGSKLSPPFLHSRRLLFISLNYIFHGLPFLSSLLSLFKNKRWHWNPEFRIKEGMKENEDDDPMGELFSSKR
jgi:hypothetical protein